MNEYNVKVNFEKGMIQTNLKKLVQNDYNSTKLNFTFDKEGRVLFKMLKPDNSQYVDDIKNNTLIFGPGILSKDGEYTYEISLYAEDGRLTTLQARTFDVRNEIVNTDEIVEVDDRVPVLDNLINEVNNIDLNMENSIITITKKDGTTITENVKGEPGAQGKPGAVKTIPVNEFPTENIELDAIYILPNLNPTSEKDKYLEYVYINGGWELFGGGSVGVDLKNYATFDDFATTGKTGVVRCGEGLYMSSTTGKISVQMATETNLDAKTSTSRPVVPSNLDYAIRAGLSANKLTWSETQKRNARNLLGVATEVDLTQAEYDALETKDENTYYNIVEE